MFFPENVIYTEFYKKAKDKGIKIVSKYKGVAIRINTDGRLYFRGECTIHGKRFNGKYYPLTQEGELKAHKEYLRLSENHLNPQYSHSNKITLK